MPVTPETKTEIIQQRETAGHYCLLPLVIPNIPPGEARYKDYVVPDFTNGVDWLNYHFYAGDADSGDKIATGKLLLGQVGQLAAPAAQGSTQIVVAAPTGVLRSFFDDGVLDEGFFVSIGTDTVTDADINAIVPPPGTGTLENPQPELREFQIKRFSEPTDIGGGNETVTLTLFTSLDQAYAAGLAVNVVVRGIFEAVEVTKGDTYNVGGKMLIAGNFPAGRRVRYGYKDSRTAGADKTIRATVDILYG